MVNWFFKCLIHGRLIFEYKPPVIQCIKYTFSNKWCWSNYWICTHTHTHTHNIHLGCWERLKAGREWDNRGWDGWMASPTRRTWVWANSGSWWWTGKPAVLQSMRSQRVRHDRATELKYTSPWTSNLEYHLCFFLSFQYLLAKGISTLLSNSCQVDWGSRNVDRCAQLIIMSQSHSPAPL